MKPIDQIIQKAAARWNIDAPLIRHDVPIAGSPERSELRFVIESRDTKLYVIESIFPEDRNRKQSIHSYLDYLSQHGLDRINPYIKDATGSSIVSHGGKFWVLSPYIDGVPLSRPGYVFDRWRSVPLAGFLIRMKDIAATMPLPGNSTSFSIKHYIKNLLTQIRRFEPGLFEDLKPVVSYLDRRLMPQHDSLPCCFCHGDYHPLNIIWSADDIHAVIDWEFSGNKPELYDVANLLGCIGIEDPEGLAGELVIHFMEEIKRSGLISQVSYDLLIDYMVALRFAWMSEWLRHNDKEMIDLETVYMKLLMNNEAALKDLWGFDTVI